MDQQDPTPPPQKAAVLAAFMLPVIALVVFLAIAGGIIFFAMRLYQAKIKPAENSPPPASVAPQPLQQPAVVPTPVVIPRAITKSIPPVSPVPSTPAEPAMPATAPVVAVPDAPLPPAPIISEFIPQIAAPGAQLILRGEGLKAVNRVQFVSSKGAKSVDGKILFAMDHEVILIVPDVPFPDDDIILIASSRGGMAVTFDQHTGATPWGTDGHLHDTAVICRTDDEIDTHDNMMLVAREGSAVSVGDNSMAFLEKNVTLRGHGKNCHIYTVGHAELAAGVSRVGVVELPSLQIYTDQDAFRVKPPPPLVDH